MTNNPMPDNHMDFLGWQGRLNDTKPPIEDIIEIYHEGDMKKSALSFALYLRENKMKPVCSGVVNTWKSMYKGKKICDVHLQARKSRCHWCDKNFWEESEPIGSWRITPNLIHMDKCAEQIITEGLQTLIWDNAYYCIKCFPTRNCAIQGGMTKVILGKEIKGHCVGRPTIPTFTDPDKDTIGKIKRLLELEQRAREEESKKK